MTWRWPILALLLCFGAHADVTGIITPPGGGSSGGGVTSVIAGSGLTGGTITSTGTVALNLANANSWTALQTFGSSIQVNASTGNSLIGSSTTTLNIGNTTDNGTTNFLGTGNVNFSCAVCQIPWLSVTGSALHAGAGTYSPAANVWAVATSSTLGIEVTAVGNLSIMRVGAGLRVTEGTNAKQNIATLAAGTVVVSNTSVTANSRIMLTEQTLGTVSVPSACGISARTAGTSFTILCSQATDTSTIAYEILEPSP